MALVLTRRRGETVYIGDDVRVEVAFIKNDQVKLAITAPVGVPIMRDDAKKREPSELLKRQLAEAAERSRDMM